MLYEVITVSAISEVLNAPAKYLGAPSFAYEVGGYNISIDGVVTGEENQNLFAGLAEYGFTPEQKLQEETSAQTEPETNRLVIEYPLDGFTLKAIDNLTKMVFAKEELIKKALGAEELPIQIPDEQHIAFPWFSIDSDRITSYNVCYTKLLRLKNGLYNVLTDELMPHDPKILSTIRLGGSYNPEAKCPAFLQYLKDVLPSYNFV